MTLLGGELQQIVADATRFLMLDATIHQVGDGTFDPATGVTGDAVTDTVVTQVGFPDSAVSQYRQDGLLAADERLLLLLQKPILDAGLTLKKGDEITMRSIRGTIQQVIEDPAEATFSLVVKDS